MAFCAFAVELGAAVLVWVAVGRMMRVGRTTSASVSHPVKKRHRAKTNSPQARSVYPY